MPMGVLLPFFVCIFLLLAVFGFMVFCAYIVKLRGSAAFIKALQERSFIISKKIIYYNTVLCVDTINRQWAVKSAKLDDTGIYLVNPAYDSQSIKIYDYHSLLGCAPINVDLGTDKNRMIGAMVGGVVGGVVGAIVGSAIAGAATSPQAQTSIQQPMQLKLHLRDDGDKEFTLDFITGLKAAIPFNESIFKNASKTARKMMLEFEHIQKLEDQV